MTVDLGHVDAAEIHSLEAELSFGRDLSARAGRSFGGVYSEEVSTALTALPLQLPQGMELPTVDEVAGWLRHRSGKALQIHSLGMERTVVFLVRDRTLRKPLPIRGDNRLKRPTLGRADPDVK